MSVEVIEGVVGPGAGTDGLGHGAGAGAPLCSLQMVLLGQDPTNSIYQAEFPPFTLKIL